MEYPRLDLSSVYRPDPELDFSLGRLSSALLDSEGQERLYIGARPKMWLYGDNDLDEETLARYIDLLRESIFGAYGAGFEEETFRPDRSLVRTFERPDISIKFRASHDESSKLAKCKGEIEVQQTRIDIPRASNMIRDTMKHTFLIFDDGDFSVSHLTPNGEIIEKGRILLGQMGISPIRACVRKNSGYEKINTQDIEI